MGVEGGREESSAEVRRVGKEEKRVGRG